MNKLFFFIAAALVSFAPDLPSTSPGTVDRQMGIGIYVSAIPDRAYDTVCTFTTRKDFNSYPGPSIPQYVEGIQKPIDDLVAKAIRKTKSKKMKKKGLAINGIITADCKTAIGIRFKTKELPAAENRSKVERYNGYYVFIQSKPYQKYAHGIKIKFNNKITIENNGITSVHTMLDSLIAKYEKNIPTNQPRANALITTTCVEAEFVHINE